MAAPYRIRAGRDPRPGVRACLHTRWTADDLEIAEALTNGGSLQRAADLCWAPAQRRARARCARDAHERGCSSPPTFRIRRQAQLGRVANAPARRRLRWHSEAALASLTAWGILLGIGLAQRGAARGVAGRRAAPVRRAQPALGCAAPHAARAHGRWRGRDSQGRPSLGALRAELLGLGLRARTPVDGAWRACGRPWLGKALRLG